MSLDALLPWGFVLFGASFVAYAIWLLVEQRRDPASRPVPGTFEARKRLGAQLLYGLGGLGFLLVGIAMLSGAV